MAWQRNYEVTTDNIIVGYNRFYELTDTPDSYSGNAGKFIIVNNSEDAVEFSNTIKETDGKIIIGSGTATLTPLVIKGAVSQTANLQEWQDSSGNTLTSIGADGTLTIPAYKYLYFGSSNYGIVQGGSVFQIKSWLKPIQIDTGAGTALYINNTNNHVGIGTTSPSEKLEVNGNVKLLGDLRLLGLTTSSSDPTTTELPADKDCAIHKNTTTGTVYLAYNDGGTIKKVTLT